MKHISRIFLSLLILSLLLNFTVPTLAATDDTHVIRLSATQNGDNYTHSASLDGAAVPEYDYTWHADPSAAHDEVKNSPAEYYTGTKPSGSDPVYIAHDIYYYPQLEQSKFKQVTYDGETEWVYMYEAPGYENYIFSTLPSLKTGFPSHMMHTAEEAYQNAVLYITKPGTYILEGTWHGQVRVDLGEDAFDDPTQKVTLILNGVDITCTVAPGLIFASVYECDNKWEDSDTHSYKVDTSDAGANVILADGTVNNVSGTNIFRILKTQYKTDNSTDPYPEQKKRLKVDGAFYSYQSMNISGQQAGTGVLNITAGYEGLNSELHLTINGGNVNIFSQDDGINVNEDGVSVLAVNGGSLHICAGLGAEGDGVDSNGYLVVNGGTVISAANPAADSGLDSDCGSYVNGGTVVALGATMDWAKADTTSTQAVLNMQFSQAQNSDEAIIITDLNNKVLFAYDPDKDEVTGANLRTYSGAIVSAPGLTVGLTCKIYIGGTITGTEISGVYDPATVTDFKDAAIQCYGGNTVGGRPEGGMGGMTPPQGGNSGMGGMTPPQGGNGGMTPPQGGTNGGMTPPDGFGQLGGNGQGMQQSTATCTNETQFTLTEVVNAFSFVSDVQHDFQQNADGSYTCRACGQTTTADGTVIEAAPSPFFTGSFLSYAVIFLAGAAIASTVFVVVLLIKKKRKSPRSGK